MSLRVPVSLGFIALLAAGPAAANVDCAALRSGFDAAIASHDPSGIVAAHRNVVRNTSCDIDAHAYLQRALEGVIGALAHSPDQDPPEPALTWLIDRLPSSADWASAKKLGEYFDARGDRRHAQFAYEVALGAANRNPGHEPSAQERDSLVSRAFAAKSLASNDNGGRSATPFPNSPRDANGGVGGLYGDLTTRVGVVKLPVPVNFVYDSTQMTPGGEAAAKELAEVVMQMELESLTLIGHADPRGQAEYNLILSRSRAEALAKALEQEIASPSHDYLSHHKMPKFVTDGKGSSEPFDPKYLSYTPSQEEIWQLDRRVEFQFGNP